MPSRRRKESSPSNDQEMRNLDCEEVPVSAPEKKKTTSIEEMLRTRLAELGSMSFHELAVLFLFMVVILLWFTRDPRIFPGWASLFPAPHAKIGDSSVA